MTKIIVDTNIVIDYLRISRTKIEKTTILDQIALPRIKNQLIISTITIQELFEGKSSKEKKEENKIRKTLSFFRTINLDSKIAELAGKIARDFGPIEFADASIAATAILEKAYLLTKNKKDFQNIKGLKIYQE